LNGNFTRKLTLRRIGGELMVLCNETDLLRELSEKIREISLRKSVIFLMMREEKDLIELLGNVDGREP
jgi:hypothetical protein